MRSCFRMSLLLLLAMSTVLGAQASAGWKSEVVLGPGLDSPMVEYHQTLNRSLSADSLYILTGLYIVDSTFALTIEPGTVVLGDTGSVLLIDRGAQIHATGTPERPIVFSSNKAPGDRTPGDWAGVLILGSAPCNKVNPTIEGIPQNVSYGGTNPDDDSGEFCYVRIEYPGYRIVEGNETNGLTMGGVGRMSEIHHVQISGVNDDAFEWFGGNCDSDYLVSWGGVDDVFDTDFGHNGRHQFCFCVRDFDWWDPAGQSNGFESDNDGTGTTDTPFTEPIFSNVTIVGPARTDALVAHLDSLPHKFEYAACWRRATKHKLFNSVIMGYPWGVSVRNSTCQGYATADILKCKYTSIQAHKRPSGSTSVHQESQWAGVTAWFDTPAYANIGSQPRNPSAIGLTDMSDLHNPNPVPAAGSELIGSAQWGDADLSEYFVQVDYRGAFDPDLPNPMDWWTWGWTNFDPQNTNYREEAAGVAEAGARGAIAQNHPNPFNPVTTISYSIREAGPVTIRVHDAAGRVVRTLLETDLAAGVSGSVVWDGNGDGGEKCASGVYFYNVNTVSGSETHKMVMLK